MSDLVGRLRKFAEFPPGLRCDALVRTPEMRAAAEAAARIEALEAEVARLKEELEKAQRDADAWFDAYRYDER